MSGMELKVDIRSGCLNIGFLILGSPSPRRIWCYKERVRGCVGLQMRTNSGLYWGTIAIACVTMAIFVLPTTAGEAAPVPDLSGLWGRNSFDYEPPASGLGPVLNTSRLPNGDNFNRSVGDYTNPILKPHAAENVKQFGEAVIRGELPRDPHNSCWPEAPPYILRNLETQIVQQPHQILIFYRDDHEVRHIRLNQPHPARVTPSAYGDSVGHWEGNTLVIDTVGIKPVRYSMIDQYGTPFSEALHLIERIRLVDSETARQSMERVERAYGRIGPGGGGARYATNSTEPGLQIHFTVEDPNTFTAPWTATVTYRRNLEPWTERVCAENNHDFATGQETDVPRAEKPDF